MSDLAALQAAVTEAKNELEAAEAAKEALLEERRANRDSMSKKDFRAYNESTTTRQLETQAAVDAAQAKLSAALNTVRQEILVGTLSEVNGAN